VVESFDFVLVNLSHVLADLAYVLANLLSNDVPCQVLILNTTKHRSYLGVRFTRTHVVAMFNVYT
jgi:hypothetical protein